MTSRLVVPAFEEEPWPSLGGEICDFIEDMLVHGPGDVLGEPVKLIDEFRIFLWRVYEVFPRGHRYAGRRRFKRAVLSRRKGVAKTELAALISICEMDPQCPVRFDGWRKEGGAWIPVGRPVRDPYIPMVAVTEEQTEDLAYGAVYEILTQDSCALVNDYNVGYERILHKTEPGVIQPLASAPSARDGARTTFENFDETHLFIQPRLRKAHGTMIRNVAKRKQADAWSLETTTMYAPGEDSVAEASHKFALDIHRGKIAVADLYFDHRQADETCDITTKKGRLEGIAQASGDAMIYTDSRAIENQFLDPQTDENDWRRYWWNQPRRTALKWLPSGQWDKLEAEKPALPADGADVVLAFNGSYDRGSTVLVGCTVELEPYVFEVKTIERPLTSPASWRPSARDVTQMVTDAMERWRCNELAVVPTGWRSEVEGWEDTWGDEVVVRFELSQTKLWAQAIDEFFQAVCDGGLTHDSSEVLARHLGDATPIDRSGRRVLASPVPAGAAAVAIAYSRSLYRLMNPGEELVGAIVVDPYGSKEPNVMCPTCRLVGETRVIKNGTTYVCRACGARWPKEGS